MNINKIKNSITYRLPLWMQFLLEVLTYWRRLCRFNASVNTDRDKAKMEFSLLRENHIIEKGMSMRTVKRGFGQAKVSALIQRLAVYHQKYGAQDNTFLQYPLSTINEYIKYQKQDNVDISKIEQSFNNLCALSGISRKSLSLPAGIKYESKNSLQAAARGDYASLLNSRHSIRYFADELPSHEIINKALKLASRTPSACNRQAWHTHVYFNEDSHRLLETQSGCNGFFNDIHCSIVVTADMKGFLGHEPFQCYIDGGMYAQNLINALNYVGLGTIPLSCGFMTQKLDEIKKTYNIPENEVLIVIIGTGILTDEIKIAHSTRKAIETTNIFHE